MDAGNFFLSGNANGRSISSEFTEHLGSFTEHLFPSQLYAHYKLVYTISLIS